MHELDNTAARMLLKIGVTQDKPALSRLVSEVTMKLKLLQLSVEQDYEDPELARRIKQLTVDLNDWKKRELS